MFTKPTLGAAVAALLATTQLASAESNLLFVLDSSGSMWGQVDGVAKITTAKDVLGRLMGDLPTGTRAGLMVYGHRDKNSCTDVELVARLGAARSGATRAALDGIRPLGKTPIAYALGEARTAFAGTSKDASNTVVLISDGIETCDGDPCAVAAALAAQNVNVKVHVVGFDIAKEDRAQLQCIAEKGKGKYFSADSTEGFSEAVSAVVKEVVEAPKPAPQPVVAPPKAEPEKPLLRDDFDGESLGPDWEVLNEDREGYLVEDGKLLLVGMDSGHLNQGNVANIIRMKTPLPKGDWVATIKFSMPYQTGREAPFLALYQDKDNHIAATTNAWSYYEGIRGARMYLSGWKRSKGEETSFNSAIWGGASGKAFNATSAPNPILLRLTKKGRTYTPAYKLDGMKQTEWIEGEKFTSLRPSGNLAFGVFQAEKVDGETPMSVDWFTLENLK